MSSTSDTTANGQPSTLKSYIDSASGAVQSAIGAVTGNPSDQVLPLFAFRPK